MQLTPTPEQQELKDAVRALLRASRSRRSAWPPGRSEPRGIDDARWRAIADARLVRPRRCPRRAAAAALGLVEVACLLQECARGLIPRRVINAIRGGWALARLDPAAPELAAVAAARSVVALAFDEQHARDPRRLRHASSRARRRRGVRGREVVRRRRRSAPTGTSSRRATAQRRVARRWSAGERSAAARRCAPSTARSRRVVALRRRARRSGAVGAAATRRRRWRALRREADGAGAGGDGRRHGRGARHDRRLRQGARAVRAEDRRLPGGAAPGRRHGDGLHRGAPSRLAGDHPPGGGHASRAASSSTRWPSSAPAFKRLTWAAHHLHGGAGYVVEHPLHYHSERAQALCIRYAPEAPALAAVAAALLDG